MNRPKGAVRCKWSFYPVIPAAVLTVVITLYAVINTLTEGLGVVPELSLYKPDGGRFVRLFTDRIFIKSLVYSFYIALISTVLCVIFGMLLGYLISRTKSPVINTVCRLPFILSYVAAGILIYTTFSDHGVLWHILDWFGIGRDGLSIVYSPSGAAVIILNCFKGIPFMAMSTTPAFYRALDRYPAIASNLGASPLQIAGRVVLPLVRHSALTTALVLFNYQMFSYEGFYYLGSSTPVSLGVLAYESTLTSDLRDRSQSMAISFVMIVISLITSCAYIRAMRKDRVTAR
ncbi:MAG: ABC transporter permease subunit [Lachnospiraceae bacterium]|nr:ABC transporter permease subunit [Lachnospiraceae bacterium]